MTDYGKALEPEDPIATQRGGYIGLTSRPASPASSKSDLRTWHPAGPGVVVLPSGCLVRGRSLRSGRADNTPPDFAVVLRGSAPPDVDWPVRWVRWRDFANPSDPSDLRRALTDLLGRAAGSRVEIACAGGIGRTGTALACLAILDGLPAGEAIAWVRSSYAARAVETPWQRRFVARFPAAR
ncbi:MAG: putative tyrosine phosphatase [Glaciihabitans sp.]|nr:putative tyrosine phosphatase [Glaciihabitans sp.]